MIKNKSKSSVESITAQFHEKFRDKMNFVNKQGIMCPMFEQQ
jgi:hypothetical protein